MDKEAKLNFDRLVPRLCPTTKSFGFKKDALTAPPIGLLYSYMLAPHNGSTVPVDTYWHLMVRSRTNTFIQFCNECFQLSKFFLNIFIHWALVHILLYARQLTVTQRVCEHSRESDFTGGKNFAHSSPPPPPHSPPPRSTQHISSSSWPSCSPAKNSWACLSLFPSLNFVQNHTFRDINYFSLELGEKRYTDSSKLLVISIKKDKNIYGDRGKKNDTFFLQLKYCMYFSYIFPTLYFLLFFFDLLYK